MYHTRRLVQLSINIAGILYRMSYIFFAWLTTLTYGLGSVVGKIATKHQITNPWVYNFLFFLLTAACVVPFAIAGGVGWPQDWNSMLWLSLANAVSGTAFVLAFYAIDLSILSPLSNLRTPLMALSGVLLLGESLTILQWVLIGIIFIAGGFINLDERMNIRSVLNKKIALGFLWILCSVWFNSMIKYASVNNGFWEVSLWSTVIATVLVLPTAPLFYRDMIRTPIKQYYGLAISTILFTAGLVFSVKALGENVSISMAIISLPLSMLITMALSVFAPKVLEKHTLKVYAVRFICAVVMFAAALGLSR